MKILVLTQLYPPHHAGTYDFRCQSIVENLKLRGHEIRVLTSTHGRCAPRSGTPRWSAFWNSTGSTTRPR